MGSLAIYKNGFPWGSGNFIFFPDSPQMYPKSAISMDLGWLLVRCGQCGRPHVTPETERRRASWRP